MSGDGLASATRFLVLALSALYALASVAGPLLLDYDATRDLLWVGFLLAGAALMLVGQLLLPRGPLSAVLVSLGAALGGLPLFWTLLVPVAVAAVIACSIALARRTSAPA
ncbi:MAG TPA: hypothetical protein VHI53_04300 [Gaiellaceae bacterium]|jgi:hypothetical protein|nr:hypothetical protein [Gaiellaceae bacterium]